MKYLLLASMTISSSAFALDFQKVTGTFEIQEKKEVPVGQNTLADASFGSFDLNADSSRMPASEAKKAAPSVNEMTGTFE